MADSPVAAVPKAVSRFEAKMLPQRPLLDTNIWLRAFGFETDSYGPRVKLCKDLVETLEHFGRRMMIATASIAEILRYDPGRRIPKTKSIIAVPFDRKAAEELQKIVAPFKNTVPGHGNRLKFDQMIVATAQRHGADCIVAIDDDLKTSCPNATINFRRPSDFLPPIDAQIERDKEEEWTRSQGKKA